jgi:hypothetical protein
MVGGFFFDCEDSMKSAYIVTPGLVASANLNVAALGVRILTMSELWEASRSVALGVIWRIRTDRNAGDVFGAGDRIESAVGLIDSTTRWRGSLAIIRTALTTLRTANINEACWSVFDLLVNRNPAQVAQAERTMRANAIKGAVEALTERNPQTLHESLIASMMMRVVFAENDVELASILPFYPAYSANLEQGDEQAGEREATVDVMVSSVALCEAFGRLAEKAPELLFTPVPVVAALAAPSKDGPGDDDED